MIAALRDPTAVVRGQAAEALGSLAVREAIPDLIKLLDDPKSYVWTRAAAALRQITGEDFGLRGVLQESDRVKAIEKWKQWWRENQKKAGGSK